MNNNYTYKVTTRPASPRSKRLRELSSASSVGVIQGLSNAHTHDDRYAKKNGDQLEDFATKNLDVKGIATFGDAIVMSNATGGGGADLPEGNLNDLLYYNGSEWVGKHKDTFGFLTDGALVGYATQAWVIERIPNIPAWALQPNKPTYDWMEIVNKPTTMGGFGITDGVLTSDVRLTNARPASDVYAWAKQATKPAYSGSEIANNYHTGNANLATVDWRARDLNVAGTAIFNGMIAMTNATGGGGGTSDYNELENIPFIGGIKVSGSKTLVDYGLMNHGLATQDWVNTRIPNVYAWALQAVKPAYGWTEITGKPTSMPASDVYAWAKASVKPAYTASEVGALAITGGTLTGDLYIQGESAKSIISTSAVSATSPHATFGAVSASGDKESYIRVGGHDSPYGFTYHPTGLYNVYNTIFHSGNLAPASVNNVGNTLVQRAANGYIYGAIYHDNYPTQNSPIGQIGYRLSQENGFHHFCTIDHFKAQLGLWSTSNLAMGRSLGDANTIADYGIYRVYDHSINTPINLGGHTMLHLEWDINAGAQMFFGYATEQYYLRKKAGRVWSPWREIWHSGNSNLATVDWSMRNATIAGTAIANGFRVKDTNGLWQGSKFTGGLRDIDVTIVSVTGNVILYPYAGNVGIGTNNPTAKLHVNGNQTVEGTAIFKGAIIMNNY